METSWQRQRVNVFLFVHSLHLSLHFAYAILESLLRALLVLMLSFHRFFYCRLEGHSMACIIPINLVVVPLMIREVENCQIYKQTHA